MEKKTQNELLAPAGSKDALFAAISAGADAVYFGVGSYNARGYAENFTLNEAEDALRICRLHGVRAYITLNTEIYDRELDDAANTAMSLWQMGADAFIVSDFGLAARLFRQIPQIELHASTQTSCANSLDAAALSAVGFSRMVAPRECSRENLEYLTGNSPLEIEVFIHGALCVSFSGQCLMSSMIGGRSGNRGMCAQPCRMSYDGGYPLSLKDLCLAAHMRELTRMNIASFKIEGRMKSAEYVYGVTSVYRRLIDEKRDADEGEIAKLERLFSRTGFTDAYYTGAFASSPSSMLGVRRDDDKAATREAESKIDILPLKDAVLDRVDCEIRKGKPSSLSYTLRGKSVTVTGDVPEPAKTQPLKRDEVISRISKLGGTGLCVSDKTAFNLTLDDGLNLRMSSLNSLRRAAFDALTRPERTMPAENHADDAPDINPAKHVPDPTAEFMSPVQITEAAREYFAVRFLPLRCFEGGGDCGANGIIMPPYIFDGEIGKIRRLVSSAVRSGARYAMLFSLSQLEFFKGTDAALFAGYRFNICSSETANFLLRRGFDFVTLSPELPLAAARAISDKIPSSLIVYGRVPLMTTAMRIISPRQRNAVNFTLTDRTGAKFPVMREGSGSVIYNSVPIYTADTLRDGAGFDRHFMFTVESGDEVDEVICAYRNHTPPEGRIRRIK